MQNRINSLFRIQYPIIQAGMVWCSGWELAAAVSNAGGLGIIGSASMDADILSVHIRKARQTTNKPFAVNVPVLFSKAEENIQTIIREGVKIVFTSAGNPAKYTNLLHEAGIKVVHVVSNLKFAMKCEEVGVDAIVAEGVEAGGHNGREETTTLTLLPLIRKHVNLPLIAAGGIGSGRAMLACMALGADGVQIGSRFVVSSESSAHQMFKNKVVEIKDGQTRLSLKKLAPVRMIRNEFCERVQEAEERGASGEELSILLGRGRSKAGMFEGNMEEGELEIGQVSALIDEIKPAGEIVREIVEEFETARRELTGLSGAPAFTDV